MSRKARIVIVLLAAALIQNSCHWFGHGVRLVLTEPFPAQLSAWRLFTGELASFTPNEGVVPYDLNTPLFSDYASKSRFVWMPPGTSAAYDEAEAFEFPRGAILVKTFSFPGRIIETRLLVNAESGWVGLPYVWNADRSDATLEIAADPIEVAYERAPGDVLRFQYSIPNQNQCKGCHERAKVMVPIGPKARHLNRDFSYAGAVENQLAHWIRIGYLKGAPPPEKAPRNAVWNDTSTGTLEARAHAYLDANCAHCHNPEGPANTSGLYLAAGQRDPLRLGFCKVPVAAGNGAGDLRFGAVFGKPDESILIRRLESVAPKIAMPELGRATVHREGAALLREWIASTRGSCTDDSVLRTSP